MKKSKTTTFYFPFSCMDVYEAVTSSTGESGFTYSPIADTDNEYKNTHEKEVKDKRILALVTDRTPGKSCAYEINAEKFNIYWSATFNEVRGECQFTMKETYVFHKSAVLPYILAVLYLKQKQQHEAFRQMIMERLRIKYFRENNQPKKYN